MRQRPYRPIGPNHTTTLFRCRSFFAVWLLLIIYVHHLQTDEESALEIRALQQESAREISQIQHRLQVGQQKQQQQLSPMKLKDITDYLSHWITLLHSQLQLVKTAEAEGIWQAYQNLTAHTLYPWDQEYLRRMPERRRDGSIFLSVATYRDENCMTTITEAYEKAQHPEHLFVGLVQQNCHHDCRTGIMEDGKTHRTEPDPDCHAIVCQKMPHICPQIRALHIDEPESLGPYMARYFASKLWYGETWFMQVDSHMTFYENWDAISIVGLQSAPSEKPVLSHYPPAHTEDLTFFEDHPASRICGPIFVPGTIRLEGSASWDKVKVDTPRFAPFTGAGYFVAHSSFLKEVPFDPFLPWIFMGEEIILSSRLWTSGYDMFSPAQAVVGHMYGRRHKPKFWESVHRAFTGGIHNFLQEIVLLRIKFQLGFPEASRDMLNKTILTAIEQYSMGKIRHLEDYMDMIHMDPMTKEVTIMDWCQQGKPPPGFEEYASLYEVKS